MYLKRLEIQGFKTFAQKTVVEFPEKKKNSNPLTVIVGPNGSGKSNIADAIRWCLGEQSMKQLRGKKTEDIIFSGSEGRSRSGFAEVTMLFENEDKAMKTDFAEVAITRRLYRDGESDYMLNGQSARLQDIQLLLAEAGVGQRSYAVIGQGMIDHVLVSSPEERKTFFDDATGVRGLQMRRHQSLLKLEKSAVNLAEVQMVIDELEPRLNMLKRQVKKLEEREKVTAELKTVSLEYFQGKWAELEVEKKAIAGKLEGMDAKVNAKRTELAAGDKKLATLEIEEVGKVDGTGSGMGELQSAYKKAQANLTEARKAQVMAEREIELAKVRAQSSWSPLPLQDIVSEVKFIADSHSTLLDKLKAVKTVEEIRLLEKEVEESLSRSKKLRDRLVKPNPEDFKADPVALAAVTKSLEGISIAEAEVKKTEQAMDAKAKEASAAKSEIFAFQRTLRVLQTELMAFEQARNSSQIEMARVETRQDALKQEAKEGMGMDVDFQKGGVINPAPAIDLPMLYEKMLRLRRQVEMIGGIEESVVKEHAEVSERFTFLSTQLIDLRAAIASTEKIVDELDKEIHGQSERALKEINHEFQKYFKILFGGGSCSLMKVEIENEPGDVGVDPRVDPLAVEPDELTADLVTSRVKARREAVIGIDIQATPPGKRLKALNLLSGGERALTSIALLCAIMATNPSPFVVLDEVDAALDEANTVRFANILNELRERTQFIVVTHNRATMEKGDTLYGVSMGGDGVSKLLSVKIEDVVTDGARR
ncbi:MAG: AAA family ATPase [Patescibacteria group bacterium]|jgi:chromosome segregation protein